MFITLLKSKIHNATLTNTDLHYEGSIKIDDEILQASGIREFEKVYIWNVTNGARLSTYVIKGQAGSKEFMLNGAAARLAQKGDKVIIAAYASIKAKKSDNYKPTIIILDNDNNIK